MLALLWNFDKKFSLSSP